MHQRCPPNPSSRPSSGGGKKSANGDIAFVDVMSTNCLSSRIGELAHSFESQGLEHQLIILYKGRPSATASEHIFDLDSGCAETPVPEQQNLRVGSSKMAPLTPRFHFYEIDDQAWFPSILREKVQSCLALAWTFKVPLFQKTSPAHLVANTLHDTLSSAITRYTFVDFCAGAGGPTPYIERVLNTKLRSGNPASASPKADRISGTREAENGALKFVLTDLHPHIPDWTQHCKKSDNLSFVSKPVDAANAPAELFKKDGKKVFRLFNLAFHHFDDPLAKAILKNTFETSDGFGIFELQERSLSSFLTLCLMGLLFMVITPVFFWHDPVHLFFTYVIPIIPTVLVFDGFVSSLRTRTADEVQALIQESGVDSSKWKITNGRSVHTWPIGEMTWIIGLKEHSDQVVSRT